jgi:hypothetical protein
MGMAHPLVGAYKAFAVPNGNKGHKKEDKRTNNEGG